MSGKHIHHCKTHAHTVENSLNNKRKITGLKGEEMAAAFLVQKGYTLVERNWRWHHCEVDIIASFNQTLHIVEVKTKTTQAFGFPEAKVNRQKLDTLKKAAAAYLLLHPQWKLLQFDIISIQLPPGSDPEIFLIEDVF